MGNILVFKIGVTCFGIETAYVKSIIKNLGWINDEPFPDFADGNVDYDGRKVLVIDLEKKFIHKTNVALKGTRGSGVLPESPQTPFDKGGLCDSHLLGKWGEEEVRDEKVAECHQIKFIVVSFKNDEFVIPIDEIVDIFQVSEKDILSIPAFAVRHVSKNIFKGVFAIGNKLVLILDIGKLLN
jgi:chemotaxis signal transduction protein